MSDDGSPMTYAEVVEERKKHLEKKVDRFNHFSERAGERAGEHWDASNKATEGIPFGQPILVGHHSQRRHEKALERSHLHADKACEEMDKQENWKNRAERNDKLLEKMQTDPLYMSHKINEAEKDIRLWTKREAKSRIFIRLHDEGKMTDLRASACGFRPGDIEDAKRDHDRSVIELQQAKEKLAYWQQELKKIGGVFDITTLRPGDMIRTKGGTFPVMRVNKKTVTVSNWLSGGINSTFNIPPGYIFEKVDVFQGMPAYIDPSMIPAEVDHGTS